MHTHTVMLRSPGSKYLLGVYNFLDTLTIPMETHPTYLQHMDTPPVQKVTQATYVAIPQTNTCILFTLGNMCTSSHSTNVTHAAFPQGHRSDYFRKQVCILICNPRNLYSISKESSCRYPIEAQHQIEFMSYTGPSWGPPSSRDIISEIKAPQIRQ